MHVGGNKLFCAAALNRFSATLIHNNPEQSLEMKFLLVCIDVNHVMDP